MAILRVIALAIAGGNVTDALLRASSQRMAMQGLDDSSERLPWPEECRRARESTLRSRREREEAWYMMDWLPANYYRYTAAKDSCDIPTRDARWEFIDEYEKGIRAIRSFACCNREYDNWDIEKIMKQKGSKYNPKLSWKDAWTREHVDMIEVGTSPVAELERQRRRDGGGGSGSNGHGAMDSRTADFNRRFAPSTTQASSYQPACSKKEEIRYRAPQRNRDVPSDEDEDLQRAIRASLAEVPQASRRQTASKRPAAQAEDQPAAKRPVQPSSFVEPLRAPIPPGQGIPIPGYHSPVSAPAAPQPSASAPVAPPAAVSPVQPAALHPQPVPQMPQNIAQIPMPQPAHNMYQVPGVPQQWMNAAYPQYAVMTAGGYPVPAMPQNLSPAGSLGSSNGSINAMGSMPTFRGSEFRPIIPGSFPPAGTSPQFAAPLPAPGQAPPPYVSGSSDMETEDTNARPGSPPTYVQSQAIHAPKWWAECTQLVAMGFTNEAQNMHVINEVNGDIGAAVNRLLARS